MNTKRDMLRKTAAFISALTFVAATNVTAFSAIAAAGTFTNDYSVTYNMVNAAVISATKVVLADANTVATTFPADITANRVFSAEETSVTTTENVTTSTVTTTVSSTVTSSETTTTSSASTEPVTDTDTTTNTKTTSDTTTTTAKETTTDTDTTTSVITTTIVTTTDPFIRFDYSDDISSQMNADKIDIIIKDINDKLKSDKSLDYEASKGTDESNKNFIKISYKGISESEVIKNLSEFKLYYPADFDWKKGYEYNKKYNIDKFYVYRFDSEKTIEETVYYKVSGAKGYLDKFDSKKAELIKIPYRVNYNDIDEYYIADNTKLVSDSFILDDFQYAKFKESDSYTVTSKIYIDAQGIFNYNGNREKNYYIRFTDITFTVDFEVKNADVKVFKNDASNEGKKDQVNPIDGVDEPNKYELTWRDLDNYEVKISPNSGFDLVKITDYEEQPSFELKVVELINKVNGGNFTRNKQGENYNFKVLGEHSTLRAYLKIENTEDYENIQLVDNGYYIDLVKNIDGKVYYLSKCEYAYSGDTDHTKLEYDYSKIIEKLDKNEKFKIDSNHDSKNLCYVNDKECYFILEYSAADMADNYDKQKIFQLCGADKRTEDTNNIKAVICEAQNRIDIVGLGAEYNGCTLYCVIDNSEKANEEIVKEKSGKCSISIEMPLESEYVYFYLLSQKINGTDKAIPMVPFYVYFDAKEPELTIKENDDKWTNHKSFLLDINELYGSELDEKININERLNNIAQITIDDLVFEKSIDQNWEKGESYYPIDEKRNANNNTSDYKAFLAEKAEIEEKVSDLKKKIDTCNGEINSIETSIKEAKNELMSLDDEIEIKKSENLICNLEEEIKELKSKSDELSKELVSEKEKLKQKEKDSLSSIRHSENVNEPYSAIITPEEKNGRIYFRVDVDISGKEGQFFNDELQIRVRDHSGNLSNPTSIPTKIECSPPIVKDLKLPEVYEGMSREKLNINCLMTDKYKDNASDDDFSDVRNIEVIFSPEKRITDNSLSVFVNKNETYQDENKLIMLNKTFDLESYSSDECYIIFRITDNAGNVGEYYYSAASITGVSDIDGATSIKLDRTAPEISEPVYEENNCYKDNEGEFWYNTDIIPLEYNIIDNESGIKSVDVNTDPNVIINAEEFDFQSEKKTNINYHLQLELIEDGGYNVNTTVYDNVGNRENLEIVVHKDSKKPKVENISFYDENGENIYSYFNENRDNSLNTDGKRVFANSDVTIRVYVKDDGADEGKSSGIKEVHIKLMDYDGKEHPEEIIVPENGKEYVEYTIPVGFKGYIQAWVIDNAGNVSDVSHEIGFISESSAMHENHADIDILLPDPDYEKDGVILYNHDITANIIVSDTYSGIKNINWTYDGNNVVTEFNENAVGMNEKTVKYTDREGIEKELKWEIKGEEKEKIISKSTDSLKVDLDKNDITIRIELEDNSTNRSSKQKTFSIDKTAPVISISGIEESNDVKYYNTYKSANITVKDRNNNTATVVINGNIERFESDNSKDIIIVKEFNTDGMYSLNITGNDLAGNRSDKKTGIFVIDTTIPKASISVRKVGGTAVKTGEDAFIGSDVELTVLVDESNFDPNSINVTINGTPFKSGSWTGESTHLLTIPNSYFLKDGKYVINVTGKDLAGNSLKPVSASFTVDKKKPDVNISGVQAANNGIVAPVIIINEDNLASRKVEIYRNGNLIVPSSDDNSSVVRYNVTGNNYITGKWDTYNGKSRLIFDNFPLEEEYDGYYTIDVATKDRADNERKESISFSVNRGGSVFIIENEENINKRHLSSAPTIRIIERNVDMHDKDDDVIIIVDKGTNTIQLSSNQYTVSKPAKLADGSGYEYIYTIEPKVFDQDLDYNISIQTVDAAGNKNVSTLRGADISFSIDTHEPEFKCDDLVDHAEFRNSEIEFRLNVNERIKHIKVTTSLKEVLLDSDGRSDGENSYVFAIPASNTARDLTVELIDLAGNKTLKTFSNLLVTENIILYAMHKTWAKAVAAASVMGLGAVGGAVFVRRKKRKY